MISGDKGNICDKRIIECRISTRDTILIRRLNEAGRATARAIKFYLAQTHKMRPGPRLVNRRPYRRYGRQAFNNAM